jgi:hypothetical protein
MPGPGPGPGQAARRPHDPRMRGTDPRQQAQPRPVQQIPQQQPQPQAQPQQNAAANLPAEQQKGESAPCITWVEHLLTICHTHQPTSVT